jgi:hypothetical protein
LCTEDDPMNLDAAAGRPFVIEWIAEPSWDELAC